ncbi:hypothetical protein AND_007177 [Anopheles darlingi]|uniref:Secreted protein n=1 Tax=Anopheles darlingi TaxID=43151 RepID=W5J9N0_ANODA|nr:hypothetical protein AND_007177 [Anopheles darlingi]
MKSIVVSALLLACVALVHSGCLPKKYPESRDLCSCNTRYDYPYCPPTYLNHYQHNYITAVPHKGAPYYGYPYGECSSCREYTQVVGVEEPLCKKCSGH